VPFPTLAADRLPTIGVLWHAANADEEASFRKPLREGFAELGYVEGKNIIFLECYPSEDAERFKQCAAELVARRVDVLIAPSTPSIGAAQEATTTIPIVFVANPDPVGLGFVASLSHPGGNVTGPSAQTFDIMSKRVEVLKEALPTIDRLGLLVNPGNYYTPARLLEQMQPAIEKFSIAVETVETGQPGDLPDAFRELSERKVDAVVVSQNAMYINERSRIADLALSYHLPTMAPADVFVEAGALMSYGPSSPPIFRNAAVFVDKILKGQILASATGNKTTPAAVSRYQPRRLTGGSGRRLTERDDYSTTRSARPSSVSGKLMPSEAAVFRFTASSKTVGCSTGKSLPPDKCPRSPVTMWGMRARCAGGGRLQLGLRGSGASGLCNPILCPL
jgi:putative tryptophan/tyrosine transport system substrate-binding protein